MRSLHVGTGLGATVAMVHGSTGQHVAAPSAEDHAACERPSKREWTISEMARDFGLTLRALRFYESKGLLSPQRFGGARYYSARDRMRLQLILNGKRMGFTLSETAEMIGQSGQGDATELALSPDTVDSQIAFLEHQRAAIEAALGSLRQRRMALSA